MTSLDVNQAVALLQKSTEVSGGSVYDHLTELVGKASCIAGHEEHANFMWCKALRTPRY